jgi:TatD DNase family protein
MKLIDTHAHLYWEDFEGEIPDLLERAAAADVVGVICIGTSPESSRQAIDLAQEFAPRVWAVVGCHPTDLREDGSDLAELEPMLAEPRVVAVGEIGLDYHWDKTTPELQKKAFPFQLDLAHRHNLPIVIHCREADDDCLAILEEQGREIPGVVHCFGGDEGHAERYLALGMHISVGGPITFKKADRLREIAMTIPTDRLLMETDSPFLAPQARRGKRNEPAYVRYNAEKFAEMHGMTLEEMAEITTGNACRLFGLELPE